MREKLWQLLGGRPEKTSADLVWTGQSDGEIELDGSPVAWRRRELEFSAEAGVRVPAWLFSPPPRVSVDKPGPALLYLHSHSGDYTGGRTEALLGKGNVPPGLGPRLAAAGFTVLAADFRCFGDRADEGERESGRRHLLQGTTLWGRMLHDQLVALDLLCGFPEVDPDRVGCFGFSMGSTAGWWLAALDHRIAAGVGLCCLSTYEAMADRGLLHRHGIYYFVPGAALVGVPAILAAIAPRPFLFLNGDSDPASPAEGARAAVQQAETLCGRQGVDPDFTLEIEADCDHRVTPAMVQRSVEWLSNRLRATASPRS
jgi:dienelactone hydrolase